jgi:hypothetical protein
VHYTNRGGEVFARCSVETTLEFLTGQAAPAEAVRQPDRNHAKDTYIASAQPTSDRGSLPWLTVGVNANGSSVNRALISFESLAELSPGTQIQSAALVLTIQKLAASAEPIEIVRCTQPQWLAGESDGTGASWNLASTQPPMRWSTPGGDFTLVGQVAGVLPSAPAYQQYGVISYDITALAQDAMANRNGVLALMIKRTNENTAAAGSAASAEFYSAEAFDWYARPMLRITYLAPPPSQADPCPADIAPTGGNFKVDIDDLLAVINAWGSPGGPADIFPPGGNGAVNIDDLISVVTHWGPCPSP